jgi:hypothetical protein
MPNQVVLLSTHAHEVVRVPVEEWHQTYRVEVIAVAKAVYIQTQVQLCRKALSCEWNVEAVLLKLRFINQLEDVYHPDAAPCVCVSPVFAILFSDEQHIRYSDFSVHLAHDAVYEVFIDELHSLDLGVVQAPLIVAVLVVDRNAIGGDPQK